MERTRAVRSPPWKMQRRGLPFSSSNEVSAAALRRLPARFEESLAFIQGRGYFSQVNVVLISTYDLGHQPFGLASPKAWLQRDGHTVRALDLAVDKLDEAAIRQAGMVALYLPMHTATRLALPVIERVRRLNPGARVICYGLYAPLNRELLCGLGVEAVIGGEFEADLVR